MARYRDPHQEFSDLQYISTCDDFYSSDSIWSKLDMLTPPSSPEPEEEDLDDCCFLASPLHILAPKRELQDEPWLATVMPSDTRQNLNSKLIQDCMWSGSDEEQARVMRSRKVSLSELTMQTASTSCVDPTTFTAYPRQQNQLEHSYSLTTPEPMKLPVMHTPEPTTDDDSESEEDLIDVVTVDTRNQSVPAVSMSSKTKVITTRAQHKVTNKLKAVAQILNHESVKRPKCMSDHDFALPSKKHKKYHSSSLLSSQSSSDTEDCEGKRSAHNVMERIRRNDLKKSLYKLRSCIPSLENQPKPSKVKILAHATEYAKSLHKQDTKLQIEYKSLSFKNQSLRDRLDFLQSRANLLVI